MTIVNPRAALTLTAALSFFPLPLVAQPAPGAVLTLEQAVRLSLERDPAAVAAEGDVASARAGVLESRGAFLPSLSANGIYGSSSNERFDQTSGRLVSENYTAQLQASYELFGGGRRFAQARSAGASLDAADARYRAQRYQTKLAPTEIFYGAAAASDLLAAAEQRLQRARQQLTFAQARLEVGTATTSDALRAELEVGNAELAVVDAESNLRTLGLELGRRVGVPGEVSTAPAALPSDAPPLPPMESLVERALRSSPAVRAAQATLKSRSAARLASYTPYLPSVRVSGGYDWFAFDFPPDQQTWSMRVIANLPIFNGFQREAAVSRAGAAERTAQALARDAEIAARVQVESAVREIAAAERRVQISERGVELAREDLRVQEERYQLGVANILDLQSSQVALADAEVTAVRARQDLGGAVARLEAVLGESIDGGVER